MRHDIKKRSIFDKLCFKIENEIGHSFLLLKKTFVFIIRKKDIALFYQSEARTKCLLFFPGNAQQIIFDELIRNSINIYLNSIF